MVCGQIRHCALEAEAEITTTRLQKYPTSVQKTLTKNIKNNSKRNQNGSNIDPEMINYLLKKYLESVMNALGGSLGACSAPDVKTVGEDWFAVPPGAPRLGPIVD